MKKPRLSHEQKIARLVSKKGATLEDHGTTESKLRILLYGCGWKKRGSVNLLRIQAAFEASGIYPEPMLTAPGLDWEELIYFSRVKPKPYTKEWYAPHPAFSSEKNLQQFLIQNLHRIDGLKHLKEPRAEYQLPSGNRIDVLCQERRTNDLVAIEIKKGKVDPVGQLEAYLVELNRDVASKQVPRPGVKGVIVTGQPNSAAERSLPYRIQDYSVKWFVYRVELKMHLRAKTDGSPGKL